MHLPDQLLPTCLTDVTL